MLAVDDRAVLVAELSDLSLEAVDLLLQTRQLVRNVADGREVTLTNPIVEALPNDFIHLFGLHVAGEDFLALFDQLCEPLPSHERRQTLVLTRLAVCVELALSKALIAHQVQVNFLPLLADGT